MIIPFYFFVLNFNSITGNLLTPKLGEVVLSHGNMMGICPFSTSRVERIAEQAPQDKR